MAGSSIAGRDAAPWVTDFLNAAYFRRSEPEVDDLRLAFCVLTTYWWRGDGGEHPRGADPLGLDDDLSVTVSIGVASANGEAVDFKALFEAADQALYAAKAAGRNRVCDVRLGVTPRIDGSTAQVDLMPVYDVRLAPTAASRSSTTSIATRTAESSTYCCTRNPGSGERGRVGDELLRRETPPDVAYWSAPICDRSEDIEK